MSKITVASIDTTDVLTPLVIATGNTSASAAQIKLQSTNSDIVITGTAKFLGNAVLTGNLTSLSVTQNVAAQNILISSGIYKAGVEFTPLGNVTSNVLTAGTTYTVPTDLVAALVYCIGGGGGGGGADNGDTAALAGGGGGGAGGTAIKLFTKAQLGSSCTFSVGGGGTAGTNAGTNGGAGSASTFTPGGTGSALTGNGGAGGTGLTTAGQTALTYYTPGAGGTASGGDINITGGDGLYGVALSTTSVSGGDGGHSIFPTETAGGTLTAAGTAVGTTPTGYGAGGGGAASINTTAGAAGGAGAQGAIWIIEYRKF
jgi:hypothetical protein